MVAGGQAAPTAGAGHAGQPGEPGRSFVRLAAKTGGGGRTEDTRALEGLLARLYETPGVTSTRSYVVLSTYLERPVQPEITAEWPAPKHMANPMY